MSMTKYREILRLSSLNLSQQNIADSCNVSKKTVNRVLKRAKELGISWPFDANETDAVLAEKFFPSAKQVKTNKRMPDYDYIRKELLRNGVSKKLLWTEYMEECRANGDEPLKQTYRSCMGLLKLTEKYSDELLEAACKKALSYTASPSYKCIKNILVTGSEKLLSETTDSRSTQKAHGITRGADYYRR